MKKRILVLVLLIISVTMFSQTVDVGVVTGDVDISADTLNFNTYKTRTKLADGGVFVIADATDAAKLLIYESGFVSLFLDGADMLIRESNFEYESGKFGDYDFVHINGTNGRIGFNTLSNTLGGVDDNLPLTSSVNLFGSIATRVRILDGSALIPYQIKQDDHIMIIDQQINNNTLMTLPEVANSEGREYTFKRNGFGTGKVTIIPQTGEKLNGEVDGSIDLNTDNSSLELVCGLDSWWILTNNGANVANDIVSYNSDFTPNTSENILEVNFTSINQTIDLDLPSAVESEGVKYVITRNANGVIFTGNVLNIVPTSSEFVSSFTNASPYVMSNDYESVSIYSNGIKWQITANYNH